MNMKKNMAHLMNKFHKRSKRRVINQTDHSTRKWGSKKWAKVMPFQNSFRVERTKMVVTSKLKNEGTLP